MTKVTNTKNSATKAADSVIDYLKKKAAATAARLKKTHPAILAIYALCMVALIIPFGIAKGMTAMLYLIADNGKKSGRADGNVYMRNGRARGFRVPALVRNAFTTIARTNLSSLSSAWNALTTIQQDTWNNSAAFFKSNRFGQSFTVKGKALYVMLNTNLLNTGNALIDVAPIPAGIVDITDLSIAAISPSVFSLAFAPTPTFAGISYLVYATTGKSNGTFRPSQSAYRLIGVLDPATASPTDINPMYLAKFGVKVTGQKVFVRLIGISIASGQASAPLDVNAIVA